MDITPNNYFLRQTTLTAFGDRGQQSLQEAKVVVIGCGGLGCAAAVYLAASGIGHLHLVDFDTVSISNLHRQVFYTTKTVGRPKTEVLAQHINAVTPFTKITTFGEAVSKENVNKVLSYGDIILDCTDNLPIKYLINDACVLANKILIYGSLYKHDGYVAIFNHLVDGQRTSNLRDAFPEIPTEHIPNCSELGTLNPIVGIIGLMQANEVLKLLASIGKPLVNTLLIYNSMNNTQFPMKLKPRFDKAQIQEIFDSNDYGDVFCEVDTSLQISQETFKKVLETKSKETKLISVIENIYQPLPFEVDLKIPISTFQNWLGNEEALNDEYILVCNQGISSLVAVNLLKEKFPQTKAKSLEGGIVSFE